MDEIKSIKVELRKLDDMVDVVEKKIHNLIGLLELLYLGIREQNRVDDSYELSSVNVMQDYLGTIKTKDIQQMHDKLTDLKERV